MSLLSLIQGHCKRHALAVPTAIIGSTDTQTNQLYQIVQDILTEIVQESKFNVTTQECVFTAVATRSQGTMNDLCPFGYQYAIFETFYDRTLMRPLYGPLTESEWEQLMALPTAGVWYKFRIWQNELFFDPIPTTPFSTIAFEYMSSWCVTDSSGTLKEALSDDGDLFVFPENIIRRGLAFQWKQVKGLPYQADETAYYNLLNNYIARDKVKRRINVSEGEPVDVKPGVFVPSNSWNV